MKTETKEVEALEKITAASGLPEKTVRDCRALQLGQAAQQGDVYIHRVGDEHPRGAKRSTAQVADGESIGARHIMTGDFETFNGVQLPSYAKLHPDVDEGEYLGPVVEVGAGGARLTHPEHADYLLGPGCFQVSYQVDVEGRARVAD